MLLMKCAFKHTKKNLIFVLSFLYMCFGATMYPLKPDDLQRIFKELDKNGDGLVSVEELKKLFERVGVHASLEELQTLVGSSSSLDSIDFFIFCDIIITKNMPSCGGSGSGNGGGCVSSFEGDLVQAFQVFDLNGDGFISSDELQSVLSRLGLTGDNNNNNNSSNSNNHNNNCENMIRRYDRNGDGKLDFEEFKNMMMLPSNSSGCY